MIVKEVNSTNEGIFRVALPFHSHYCKNALEIRNTTVKMCQYLVKMVFISTRVFSSSLGSGHFKSWVPGWRIFGRSMKHFSNILWGHENIMGYETILLEKCLMKSLIKAEKLSDTKE